MGRRRRARREPYSLDMRRYSVYPSRRGRVEDRAAPPSVGDHIELRITALDEYGRGIGLYRGFKVLVEDATPGTKVEAVVVGRKGGTIKARLLRVLEEG